MTTIEQLRKRLDCFTQGPRDRTVYTLASTRDRDQPLYVGQTNNTLSQRLRLHISSAVFLGKQHPVAEWIRLERAAGFSIVVQEVSSGLNYLESNDLEERLIVTLSRMVDLKNVMGNPRRPKQRVSEISERERRHTTKHSAIIAQSTQPVVVQ